MVSLDGVQAPLVIVQAIVTVSPGTSPVNVVVANDESVMVAVPDTIVHSPAPMAAALPVIVVAVTLHRLWSEPAAATVGTSKMLITIVSFESGQEPFDNVHRRVSVPPMAKAVTPVVGSVASANTAVPDIKVQRPLPATGVLPANVEVVTLHSAWSVLAAATG